MNDRIQLKRASELLVKSIGGIEPAAALLGRGHSTVGRWTNRNDLDYSMPLAEARELEANAPEPLVTKALCRLNGGVFVPLPVAPGCDSALPAKMMEIAAEVGDISRRIGEGLANDGVLDAGETARVLDEVHEAEQRLAELRAMLELGRKDQAAAKRGRRK